jgi:hypothetical protein
MPGSVVWRAVDKIDPGDLIEVDLNTGHARRLVDASNMMYIDGMPTRPKEAEQKVDGKKGPLVDLGPAPGAIPRETHPTGAVREIKSERFDLIPTEPIRLLALHYGIGAKKYAPRNWEKGLPWSNMYNSCMRHLQEWLNGGNYDTDTGSLHLVAAIWNLVGLVEFAKTHPELDDRKVPGDA